MGLLGTSTRTTALSSQVWTGSSPVTLTLPIDFVAISNAAAEVIAPVKQLMKMALPEEVNLAGVTTLDPPGPAYIDGINAFKGVVDGSRGDNITISVGSFLRLAKVIIRSVNCNWSGRLSAEGFPMQCRAEVEARTFTAITKDQLEAMVTA